MKHLLSVSLLSADFSNLQKDIYRVNTSDADWFHLDVMDGVFVPNITIGLPVIKSIKKHSKKPFDVHLMIVNPDRYIQDFKDAGADILNVHFEACTHLHRTIQKIKSLDMKAGVTLNPHTPVHFLEDIINDVDIVQLMSVNPGFGGQVFIENTFTKIFQLKQMIKTHKSHAQVEVDGGVGKENAKKLVESGADILVSGYSIFHSENPIKTITFLKKLS